VLPCALLDASLRISFLGELSHFQRLKDDKIKGAAMAQLNENWHNSHSNDVTIYRLDPCTNGNI
jgi:hypothetical protein